MNKSELLYLLKKHNIRPKRQAGQNFLINDQIIKKIIKNADLDKNDVVLEIGAGLGNLTLALAKNCKKVIAVEPDKEIFPVLEKLSKANKNIIPINQGIFNIDFLKIQEIKSNNYKIISNLPYQITSHVFKHFLQHGPRPKSMTVMVQKEVGERICAQPGKHSLLSLGVQFYSDPKIAFFVPKNNFYPQPKVDSAVLCLKNIKPKYNIDEKEFFRVLRIGFSAKRKKLVNNLENGLKLGKNNLILVFSQLKIHENTRPQDLSLKQWISLIDAFSKI